MSAPVYVSPFLGAGADWLCLLSPDLVPPVSWMGGKRRLAASILAMLGLRPGYPIEAMLGDASWWGWVWPVVLDEASGPEACAVLRSWRGEDPRALWFRLRDVGPMEGRAESTAQLLWLQARAASGVPVWWEGVHAAKWDRNRKGNLGPANQTHAAEPRLLASDGRGVPRETGQRSDRAPALLQWAGDGRTRENQGKGFNREGSGGIIDPGTIAARLEAIRATRPAATILHTDALSLSREHAPLIGAQGRVYLDPPYQGCTGYPESCPRDEVLLIAETWAKVGARVVLSEAVPLAAELGAGWESVQLGRGRKAEWVTCFGCDVRAHMAPLLRMMA